MKMCVLSTYWHVDPKFDMAMKNMCTRAAVSVQHYSSGSVCLADLGGQISR